VTEETKLLLLTFLSYLFDYLILFVSTVFRGHLGKVELDGVTLATAVTGNLCLVGVITQKAILILLLACLPCCKNNTFILVSQAAFMYIIEAKYLQNQGIIWPLVITGVVTNTLNALINYIFLFVLDMGVTGSAAANTISQYSLTIILFIYIRWTGLHKDTWPGELSMDCLQEWDSFIHLAIQSMLMMCAEWWTYEIGGLLSGEVEFGAQSVVYGLANIAYMFPVGFSVAGNVRVGNAMGAGDVAQAKLSAKLSMILVLATESGVQTLIILDVVPYTDTSKTTLQRVIWGENVNYYFFLQSNQAAGGSIVKGLGKQKIGAICNLVGYYAVGFPIGIFLMFAAKWGIFGEAYM
uniref:Solute carrier family 47 member 3 n=1 Tax=Sinocyclocheilus anshuiensis TaxID=1608454 RepID=A0A671MH86_9TELE